ncbi:MAG: DUF4129 domain-containing protein [Flavobacteriales bacterium]|nr:MAG: DUF4129 domain-containing protein [Flavobacteriales bacterium]
MKKLRILDNKFLKSYLFILFIFCSISLLAQTDSLSIKEDQSTINERSFNELNIEKYKNNNAFDYRIVTREPTWYEELWDWVLRQLAKFFKWIFGNETGSDIVAVIARLLPYIIGAVILFLFVKFFLKINMQNINDGKKNKTEITISEDEKLIQTADLNELIKKVLAQNNYRLAIRYYYLKILQRLSKKKIIDWQGQKTNEDYLNEIPNAKLKSEFSKATYLYDFIWYGEFSIDNELYAKAEKQFDKTFNQIK